MSTNNPKKLLAWSDSVTVATGFGRITNYVMQTLKREFSYEIDILGLNYFGDFYDRVKYPFRVSPANSLEPRDPSGKQQLLRAIELGEYDYIWIQLDIQHIMMIFEKVESIKCNFEKEGRKFPVIIYYVPIDMELHRRGTQFLNICDHIVTYTQFGADQILKYYPELEGRVSTIECAYDSKTFVPLSKQARKLFRKSFFGLENEETFLLLNINRNSTRKMLAHVLKVYAEFRKNVPNSKLYIHTDPNDRSTGISLHSAVLDLGLTLDEQVQFPEKLDLSTPTTDTTLAAIYNAADCFFTAAHGEGWGLTHTEAMAMRLPVVAPDNTVFPEQLDHGNRGYLYPCVESHWFQGIGYRPVPRIEDALSGLQAAYDDKCEMLANGSCKRREDIVEAAYEWMMKHKQDIICKEWIQFFKQLESKVE